MHFERWPAGAIRVRESLALGKMAFMVRNEVAEVWSEEDLDVLLGRAWADLDESLVCHRAGAPHAALSSLAGSFEAVLLATVVAQSAELQAAGFGQARPSRLHLAELVGVARRMGWLQDPIADRALTVFNTVRAMAAHPGAYARGLRQIADADFDLGDPAGYLAMYEIVQHALGEVAAATTTPTP